MHDFHLYGDWLREKSPETLVTYFGITISSTFINSLIDGILSNPEEHYFSGYQRHKMGGCYTYGSHIRKGHGVWYYGSGRRTQSRYC